MTQLANIAAGRLLAFGFLLFAFQVVAHEVGFWVGRRQSAQRVPPSKAVGVLVGGMLALLAFVLAVTYSFANDCFSERRGVTLAEANAIGTAWLRAEAVGKPQGDEVARLLEQYTLLRAAFVEGANDPTVLNELDKRTSVLQSEIWGHLSAVVRETPNPVTISLMASLIDVFDMAMAERFAFELRLPPQIFWLLIGMTLLGMAALGYQLALRGPRARMLVVLLTLTWTGMIVDIVKLTSMRFDNIRTATYERTLRSFQGSAAIQPPATQ